jgi:hypothetical protein
MPYTLQTQNRLVYPYLRTLQLKMVHYEPSRRIVNPNLGADTRKPETLHKTQKSKNPITKLHILNSTTYKLKPGSFACTLSPDTYIRFLHRFPVAACFKMCILLP